MNTERKIPLMMANLGNRRFEIVFGGEGIGFYIYVFEGERCTQDYLQDTVELARSFAEETFGVPVNSWKTIPTGTIVPQSPMSAVLDAFPGAQRALFRRYHIGGCSQCGFQPTETLEQVCQRNGDLNPQEVLDAVKAAHEEDAKVLIAPAELAALRAPNKSLRLLDVRSREEYEAVHIEGAVLMSQPVMQEILSRWRRDEAFVIYDHQGKQGLDAAAYFMGQGFTNVRCLRGGIDAWSQEVDAKVPRYRVG